MTTIILRRLTFKSVEEIDKSREDGDTELLVSIMPILKTPRSFTRMQRELKTTVRMRKPLSMVEDSKLLKLDLVLQAKCQLAQTLLKGQRVYSRISRRRLLISTKNGRLKMSWLDLRPSSTHTKEYTSTPPTLTETPKMAA